MERMSKSPFPIWIRRSWPSGTAFQETKQLLDGLSLHTVCQSAHCPNQSECWQRRTATFMILGSVCTRHCHFCAVQSGAPVPVDLEEPGRVAEAVVRMGLRHAVITSVTRDDLSDGGSGHFARTVLAIKEAAPGVTVETLSPDFSGDLASVQSLLDAGAEVFGHNIETVERLHPEIRDRRYSYERSLDVLRYAAAHGRGSYVKSGLMLGLGETADEVQATLRDLRGAGASVVTLGQYLQPTALHAPVASYLTPEMFRQHEEYAYSLGYCQVVSGPFVRSSYRAEALFCGAADNRDEG